MNITQTREQAIVKLQEELEEAQIRASALTALAEFIEKASIPQLRYERTWRQVMLRIRTDAGELLRLGNRLYERIEDLNRAQRAAEEWTPPDPAVLTTDAAVSSPPPTLFEQQFHEALAKDLEGIDDWRTP